MTLIDLPQGQGPALASPYDDFMGPDNGPFDAKKLHVAMMGSGDPRRHLTPLRKRLLRALLDDPSDLVLGRTFGLAPYELATELEPLESAGLVTRTPEGHRPALLVVAAEEVAPVVARARRSAAAQAAYLETCWLDLQGAMGELEVVGWDPPELAFFLVGNWLLDQSLLAALARDGDLMPPAPHRPSPNDLEARYYLWLVEGRQEDLGRYGQRASALPWEGWHLVTFGEYVVNGDDNSGRMDLEARAVGIVQKGDGSPTALARALGVPAFSQNISSIWLERTYPVAEALVGLYRAERPDLERLYSGLRASSHLRDGLGEFVCWYDHLVFAHTIDLLAERGKMVVPSSRFVAALWQTPTEG
jgi:hypothetical protein